MSVSSPEGCDPLAGKLYVVSEGRLWLNPETDQCFGMGNICNNKAAEGSPSDPRALPGLAAASIGSIILRAIDNKTENSPCIGLSSLGSRNLGSSTKR
jgi:hypothetical protein